MKRNRSQWIWIAILLFFNINIGVQQAVTSCPSGQFLANHVGSGNTSPAACVEQKYFVYDASYYSTTFVGTCDSTNDELLPLQGEIYKGCVPKSQLTYLCPSYIRTPDLSNSASHGLYACTGCPSPFKYIVKISSTLTGITAIKQNPLGVTTGFNKACTVQLVPNCATYNANGVVGGSGVYSAYKISKCESCSPNTATLDGNSLNYINAAVDSTWATTDKLRLGIPCVLTLVNTAKGCDVYRLSEDRQSYDCDVCIGGGGGSGGGSGSGSGSGSGGSPKPTRLLQGSTKDWIKYYQKGTYNQRCVNTGTVLYYDVQCILYDDYDLAITTGSTTTGNCIKCKTSTTHDLIKVLDTVNNIVKNACILKSTLIAKQPCSSYSWNPTTASLTCTGCPGGYILTGSGLAAVCILNDRYLDVANCNSYATISSTAASKSCASGQCVSPLVYPYCSTFVGAVRADITKNQLGTRCVARHAGSKQIFGTFVRTDTNAMTILYACAGSGEIQNVIDACISYKVTISYSSNVFSSASIDDLPSSCSICDSFYTRVLSQISQKYICIKNALVDQNCQQYYIQTLKCKTCKSQAVFDPVTSKCKAPKDYIANCANAVRETLTENSGNVKILNRCIGCLPGFTLIRIGDDYFCPQSVFGCQNLTDSGVCYSCASKTQQLVERRICVTLPLNCKNVGSDGKCIDCNDGFIFNQITFNCDQIANFGSNIVQITCRDGQYLDSNGVCVNGSIVNCAKYKVLAGKILCAQCNTGYHTSHFDTQCDLDDLAQGGIKCQDQPSGDAYAWVKGAFTGACLKMDKYCGDYNHQDSANQRIYCGTCKGGYQPNEGRCYSYQN